MRRKWSVEPMISRVNKTIQVGADEETRKRQAKSAYEVFTELNKDAQYLLIDDVWTTGASMEAAIAAVRKAGAVNIASAVVLFPSD